MRRQTIRSPRRGGPQNAGVPQAYDRNRLGPALRPRNPDARSRGRRPARRDAPPPHRLRQPRRLRAACGSGQAIHSRYQEEALAERPHLPARGRACRWRSSTAAGRCASTAGSTACAASPTAALVVEEIKSVRRGGQLSPTAREIYQRQALLYAWMLGRARRGHEVRAELVLIEIGSDDGGARAAGGRLRQRSTPRSGGGSTPPPRLRGRERRPLRAPRRRRAPALPLPRDRARARSRSRRRSSGALANARAPAAPGDHRHRQDGRGPLSRAALRPAARQAALRAHRQDPAAGHGHGGAQAAQPATAPSARCACAPRRRCAPTTRSSATRSTAASPRTTSSSSRPRGRAARLLDEQPTLEPDAVFAAAKEAEVCPFEVSLDLAAPRAGRGLRLQLRLRPLRGAHRLRRRRRPLRRHPGHRRGPQPGRARARLLLARSCRRRPPAPAAEALGRGGEPIHRELERLCLDLARVDRDARSATRPGGGTAAGDRAVECAAPRGRASGACGPSSTPPSSTTSSTSGRPRPSAPTTRSSSSTSTSCASSTGCCVSDAAFSHCVELARRRSRGSRSCARTPAASSAHVINRTHATIGSRPRSRRPSSTATSWASTPAARRSSSPQSVPGASNRRVVIDTTVATTWQRAPGQLRPHRRAPRRVRRRGARQLPGALPELRLPRRGRRSACGRREQARPGPAPGGQRPRARRDARRRCARAIFGDVLLLAVAGGVFAEGVDYPGEMLRPWRSSAPACRR